MLATMFRFICRMAEEASTPYKGKMFTFLCFMFTSLIFETSEGRTLKFVTLVYRHGDRSPIHTFPSDPFKEDAWPQGYGQLTTLGMQQQYELGQFLRKRYSGFLNSTYDHREVFIRSSDYDRTLMSAQANLAGLYPPQDSQLWNRNISWQPIPVHTVPLPEEKLLRFPLQKCPAYEKLLNETWESEEYKKRFAPYEDFIRKIQLDTGFKPEEMTLQILSHIHDALLCEEIHKFKLPEWVNTEVITKLEELALLSFQVPFEIYKQEEKSRLQGGVLVNAILTNISQAAQHTSQQQKMIIYSAHDTTIAALQIALNVFSTAPPYCACHIFELYEDNGNYQIGMFYRNDSAAEPYEITLPGCTTPCPLEKFIQLTSDIITTDWEKECKIDNSANNNKGVVTGLAITVCFLLIMIFGLLYILCKRTSIRFNNFESI